MMSASMFSIAVMLIPVPGSAATHRGHYLYPVAIGQQMFGVTAARHDLAVAFQCYALACQSECRDQVRAGAHRRKLAVVAVNGKGEHAWQIRGFCRPGR